jgi:hypothetical protein
MPIEIKTGNAFSGVEPETNEKRLGRWSGRNEWTGERCISSYPFFIG